MQPFKFHILVCAKDKPEGAPSCGGKGARDVLSALRRAVNEAGLQGEVRVTECGCLGLCARGPNMIVEPGGHWYPGVTPEKAARIFNEHIKGGKPVPDLLLSDPEAAGKEILEHDRMVMAMKEEMAKSGIFPHELMAIARGFMESRALLTAIELDIFSAIGDGAGHADVANRIGADPRATETLLNALAAMGLIEKREGAYHNSETAGRFLRSDSKDDARLSTMHMVGLWDRWSTLTECVREGTSVARKRGEERDEEGIKAFIAAMHRNASFRAEKIMGQLDLAGVKKALDLGGGSGAYAMALAGIVPGLDVTVMDLPAVVELTEQYIEDAGLSGKVKTAPGDMMESDLGSGYDLVLLSAIAHMWGPGENKKLFARVKEALAPGGRLVIQDFVLDDDKTGPRAGAVFALNMLVNTRAGSSYSFAEYSAWLREVGYARVDRVALPGPTDLVIGSLEG